MTNVLQYLEETSKKYPNKTAVSMREQQLSFSQLQSKAKRLGATLRKKQSSGPIGVFANRSIETALWFLAVLYSGCFYVPLDPELPEDKLRSIMNDANLVTIAGAEENRSKLDALGFDGSFVTAADMSDSECDFPTTGAEAPLYMVYTSGSTGKPKGVLKSHQAMISFLEAYCEAFHFSSDEVIGNQTPFFFDASAKDFYLMLKAGATLEIIPTELFSLPPMLMDYLNEKKITFASWVPTAISIVARLNPFSLVKPEYLRRLFFVGEVMPLKHLNKWRESLPELMYVNLYGQSEIAGICCYYQVGAEADDMTAIPIGKPLGNCRVYLYDDEEDRLITESGRIGQLYISGPALATEYYHDEQKTAASFVERDFGDGPVRCFRSGDLAQYDRAGNLIFANRSDFQIKHMGHRIELGEIESVADLLPEVAHCCCLYDSAAKKIVLFCEPEAGAELTQTQLRAYLRTKLSSYMLPAKIVIMDSLPTNANGKIDRRKLGESLS